jgi:DNA sulfur modification protein DndD
MIFTRLTINDFGVFHGEHTLELSPRDHRPIVLFGGKNGAGKSTVLEAIRLCLYGPGALGVFVSKEEYLRYLASKIHSNPNVLIQPSFASIQVEFQYSHSTGLATYKVARAWENRNGTKISETLSIHRNGKTLEDVEAENWQEFIRELIPPGVSQLFFFDGEKIQQLAEDATDQNALADAIKSLLGIDIVERLQADLRLHVSRLAKPNRDSTKLAEVRELETLIQRVRAKLSRHHQQRAEQEKKIQDIKAKLERAEKVFSSQGGVFARNRDNLIQQEGVLKERIAQLDEAVRQAAAGLLPFTLVPDLCDQLKAQIRIEERAAQIKSGRALLHDARSELKKKLCSESLFSDIPSISQKAAAELKARIARTIREPLGVDNLEEPDMLHQFSETETRLVLGWIEQAGGDLRNRVHALADDLERAHRELHKVSDTLRKVPTDDVLRPILEEIHALNERLVKASTDALLKDQNINALELELHEAERNHAFLAQKLAAAARHSGKLHVLPRVQKALDEYRTKLIDRKVTQLQGAVTECFNLLCRKKDTLRTIRIDSKAFSISLCDRQNRPLQKAQLSAGEKQIYAVSMLWALAKTSGRPLPIVIDTPLARLDSDHRRLLIEHYFPRASHQVIVLSTDTEVDQMYFDQLRPSIARVYHLDYDQAAGSTSIKQGYFWKERDEAYKAATN